MSPLVTISPKYKCLKELSAHPYNISSVLIKIISYLTFHPFPQKQDTLLPQNVGSREEGMWPPEAAYLDFSGSERMWGNI